MDTLEITKCPACGNPMPHGPAGCPRTLREWIENDIVEGIIKREGGHTNDPQDRGGETIFGISKKSNPEAWKNGPPTKEQAIEIYTRKYIKPFKGLEGSNCFEQAVDFGVTSGPTLVIRKIQEIVGAEVDGVIGGETLTKVSAFGKDLNLELAKARIKMIGRLVSKDISQVRFLNGWLNRSLEFL